MKKTMTLITACIMTFGVANMAFAQSTEEGKPAQESIVEKKKPAKEILEAKKHVKEAKLNVKQAKHNLKKAKHELKQLKRQNKKEFLSNSN